MLLTEQQYYFHRFRVIRYKKIRICRSCIKYSPNTGCMNIIQTQCYVQWSYLVLVNVSATEEFIWFYFWQTHLTLGYICVRDVTRGCCLFSHIRGVPVQSAWQWRDHLDNLVLQIISKNNTKYVIAYPGDISYNILKLRVYVILEYI